MPFAIVICAYWILMFYPLLSSFIRWTSSRDPVMVALFCICIQFFWTNRRIGPLSWLERLTKYSFEWIGRWRFSMSLTAVGFLRMHVIYRCHCTASFHQFRMNFTNLGCLVGLGEKSELVPWNRARATIGPPPTALYASIVVHCAGWNGI